MIRFVRRKNGLPVEWLLRIQTGYASHDGRFYADRVAGRRWRALDVSHPKSVEQMFDTLRECREWFKKRRRIRL